jgi:hypothetical protein
MPLGQMQVDCRYFQVAMPKQDLNGAQVGAGFEKVGRETVAQRASNRSCLFLPETCGAKNSHKGPNLRLYHFIVGRGAYRLWFFCSFTERTN